MNTRRVVVTGMGIVSCLGNQLDKVSDALRTGRSGIVAVPEYAELGFRSCVAGMPIVEGLPPVNRRLKRYMADAALQAYHATQFAIQDAALAEDQLRHARTGLIVGSGVGSLYTAMEDVATLREKGASKVPPYEVPRVMASTTSANLATAFGILGTSYSITSACATSAHAIGHGAELIQFGKQDCVIVGGAEELRWTSTMYFDAMGALASNFNDQPERASRPYDAARGGFVIAGGAGILVLESLEHAQRRGARIYGELTGYGATSDGHDMVNPDASGATRAMLLALDQAAHAIDYLNAHATATRVGDITELRAIRNTFGEQLPLISSTKGLTGHAIGAAGAHEAIYGLLMMRDGFVAGCANLDDPDPETAGFPLLRETQARRVDAFMSNSFGFGGTNASLIFRRLQ